MVYLYSLLVQSYVHQAEELFTCTVYLFRDSLFYIAATVIFYFAVLKRGKDKYNSCA